MERGYQAKTFSLEEEALRASGIEEKERVAAYLCKLNNLHQQFIRQATMPPDPVRKGELLFKWLWIGRPGRYKSRGNFKLDDVIDAQLGRGDNAVGNCLGLTLLYNCLLRRAGVKAGALYLENGFGKGPHVLTILDARASSVDIENIFPDGFDYKGHLKDPSRTRWGDRELVADIYHSVANELFEKGQWVKALKNYEAAVELNPQYEKACLNRTILLDRMGSDFG